MSSSSKPDEDRVMVDLVLAGQVSAFSHIVSRWERPLVNMAWRFCHDRTRAEDMAQEAFLRAYRNLAQWKRESSFSTWLFAIAANVYRSELKHTLQNDFLCLDDIAEPCDPRQGADALEVADLNERIYRAVASLPEKYRLAVELYYFHEQNLLETSETLGRPQGTVKAHLSRAREMLKKKLERSWRSAVRQQAETRLPGRNAV